MNKVIVIYGPTAVGKSAIAVELAKLLNGEIISADSMQIYKHLNIGSAKITVEEMQGIKHHLIDFLEPWQEYSASSFACDAKELCKKIIHNNHTPIIVGGTGLYINGLINGFNFCSTSKNIEFRNSIEELTNEQLLEKIQSICNSEKVDKNNRQRLIRTLERLSFGVQKSSQTNNEFEFHTFAIIDDRQKIYERINSRVDKMLSNGLLDEAKYVYSLNLPHDSLAIKAIGYKELFPYFERKATLDECANILKQKTRNYAKRQFTYMNQFDNINKIEFCGIKETAIKIYNIIEETNE